MDIVKFSGQRFCHLHVHSDYSPQDSAAGLKDIVRSSMEMGYKSVALTDHGTVAGWVKFQKVCKEYGVKPIFGIEAYFTPDRHIQKTRKDNYHIVLLAKNGEGIKNIYRMSELAFLEGFYYHPRIDWELLEKYNEGVVCTSACVNGIVPKTCATEGIDVARPLAERFRGIFGDDYYLEVQAHGLEIEQSYANVARIAADTGISIVGTNDVHYVRQKDWGVQAAMTLLCTGKSVKDPSAMKQDTAQFYLKSPDEMLEIFGGLNSEAVQSTLEIMDKCNAEITMGKTQLPSIEIPKESESEFEHLKKMAYEGLKSRGKSGLPEYEARMVEELEIIRKLREQGKAFDRYFLIVSDYVNWAWDHGVRVGIGRGSGAGSLVLYCLRVTGIDPIPYGLLFERFLSEDRVQMPDIDIDFDPEFSDRVFEYLQNKYGKDYCAKIGTVGMFKPASAIRAAFRVFDPGNTYEAKQKEKYEAEQRQRRGQNKKTKEKVKVIGKNQRLRDETARIADEVAKLLPRAKPNDKAPDPRLTLRRDVYEANPEERVYAYDASPALAEKRMQYPEIFEVAEAFEGLVEKRSTHAAGILITESPINEFAPRQFVGKKESVATAFDMDEIESIGGIKFDLLRTKVLSVISHAVSQIKERHGKAIPIDDLEPNDPRVFKIFANGDTDAVFQFESDGMKRLLKDMKPDCFEDIIAANALFRPGPMEYIESFVNRKHGRQSINYPVPILKQILSPTYGIMVYQEQVMQIVRLLAGFTGAEADNVRKAMGKKKKDVLDSMSAKFLKGCQDTGTCTRDVAEKIWRDMEAFASYAFNKSHSAAYGYTAYQCAFLKCYYRPEFMAAQLTVEGGDSKYEVVSRYEKSIKEDGTKLLPLDLNLSSGDYVVTGFGRDVSIRKGFKGFNGIGADAYNDIVAGQPYKDMYDFCYRAGKGEASDVVRVLVSSGAFDWIIPKLPCKTKSGKAGRPEIMHEYEKMTKRAKIQRNIKGAQKEELEGMNLMFSENNDDDVLEF